MLLLSADAESSSGWKVLTHDLGEGKLAEAETRRSRHLVVVLFCLFNLREVCLR